MAKLGCYIMHGQLCVACMTYSTADSTATSGIKASLKKNTFYRGGYRYQRPIGSFRYGTNVLNKFGSNVWLGPSKHPVRSVNGEWPVAYHGTKKGMYNQSSKKDSPSIRRNASFTGKGTTARQIRKLRYILRILFKFRVESSKQFSSAGAVKLNRPLGAYWIVKVNEHVRHYGLCIFEVGERKLEERSVIEGKKWE